MQDRTGAEGKVIVNGILHRSGTICMDQCMIDVTHVPYPRLSEMKSRDMGKDGI
ncbi:MAG: alanine racemase C-terminal domain-containing protein [Clostridia bacterium]